MQLMKEKMASDLSAPYEVVIASFSPGLYHGRTTACRIVACKYPFFVGHQILVDLYAAQLVVS